MEQKCEADGSLIRSSFGKIKMTLTVCKAESLLLDFHNLGTTEWAAVDGFTQIYFLVLISMWRPRDLIVRKFRITFMAIFKR